MGHNSLHGEFRLYSELWRDSLSHWELFVGNRDRRADSREATAEARCSKGIGAPSAEGARKAQINADE